MEDRASRLKEWRKQNGLTCEEAARYLGVTRALIVNYEAEKLHIPNVILNKLDEPYVPLDQVVHSTIIDQIDREKN